MTSRFARGFSRTGVLVLLTAFLMRALVPAGWMPGTSAGTPVVICTAAGAVMLNLDADGKPVAPQKQQASELCLLAGITAFLAAASADALPTAGLFAEAPLPAAQEPAYRPLRFAASAARAPPSFA